MVDLSLIIPCYNDGPYLEKSLQEIELVLEQTRYTYEFILIDDCSRDGSASSVEKAASSRSHARYVLHENNVGRGGTVSEGIRMAQGTYAGYLDIDLEVHCRYIPSMLLSLEEGYDGATAYRIYEIHWNVDTFFRHILSVGYRRLVRSLLKLPYLDTETGCKFFKRECILPLLDKTCCPGWFWDTEIMAHCHYQGLKIKEIPALFIRRWDKPSTVKPIRDSLNYLRELLRFRARIKKDGLL